MNTDERFMRVALDLAKKGTDIEPSHSTCQACLPVARSKARTTSVFLFTVSVVNTRPPETMGPE